MYFLDLLNVNFNFPWDMWCLWQEKRIENGAQRVKIL